VKFLRNYSPTPGLAKIVSKGRMGLKLMEFGLLQMRKGEEFALSNGNNETALVVLGGKCVVSSDGFEFKNVGDRKDVFSGKAHTVYIPCKNSYRIKALTKLEIAWIQSPSELGSKPAHITPDMVRQFSIGRDNFTRTAFMIIDDRFDCQHFFIGEALVPPGNWASYPPHRHDVDNLPVEVDMEETYFFRFNPSQGFGIQKIYTDNRSIDVTYTILNNDTVGIPKGYHPVVCAPGYTMYYLWIMTGKNRKFLSYKDPAHARAAGSH